jgi:cyanophycin synthetase
MSDPVKPIESIDPPEPNTCFDGSRRLTGPNRYFREPAAVLEPRGPRARDAIAHTQWQAKVLAVCKALGWLDYHPPAAVQSHIHHSDVFLTLRARWNELFTATEVCEWAWEQVCGVFHGDNALLDEEGKPYERVQPISSDIEFIATHFAERARVEIPSALNELARQAAVHDVPMYLDDDEVSFGAGQYSVTFNRQELPATVDWSNLRDIPKVLVTGSNGKTTTTRLIAAMLKAKGHSVGYCSTEGVVINGEKRESGDYSGPAGARRVLRDQQVDAAVLETARGGMLRRGLAVDRADCSVITNISADHFGEYGIDDLAGLAEAKHIVARALFRAPNEPQATLVLNADDPSLAPYRVSHQHKIALFGLDESSTVLEQHHQAGGVICVVSAEGQLVICDRDQTIAFGAIRDMPLTLDGAARYNVANLAAASLAAYIMQVPVFAIADVCRTFGSSPQDNPGRLTRFVRHGRQVLVDYAHNPEGLAGLLNVASTLQEKHRSKLHLLLGQAGNRDNEALRELAHVAARAAPDRIMLKDMPAFLRGRAIGEVPTVLRAALVACGFPATAIDEDGDELSATKRLVERALPGDIVVLPVHQSAVREELIKWLQGAS